MITQQSFKPIAFACSGCREQFVQLVLLIYPAARFWVFYLTRVHWLPSHRPLCLNALLFHLSVQANRIGLKCVYICCLAKLFSPSKCLVILPCIQQSRQRREIERNTVCKWVKSKEILCAKEILWAGVDNLSPWWRKISFSLTFHAMSGEESRWPAAPNIDDVLNRRRIKKTKFWTFCCLLPRVIAVCIAAYVPPPSISAIPAVSRLAIPKDLVQFRSSCMYPHKRLIAHWWPNPPARSALEWVRWAPPCAWSSGRGCRLGCLRDRCVAQEKGLLWRC